MPEPVVTPRAARLWSLWGKWNSPTEYHPLLCHMLDVAAVANRLVLEIAPAARKRFESFLGEGEALASWLGFLAALHDLGKASPAFQFHPGLKKRDKETISERLKSAGLPLPRFPAPVLIRHGVIGAKVSPSLLAPRFGFSSDAADAYARIVGGHHGAFPTLYEIGALEIGEDAVGSDEWDEARHDLVDLIAGRFKIDGATPPRVPGGPDAIALAGLVSVADWIGSMREYFGFAVADGAIPDGFDLDFYAAAANTHAERALAELRWINRSKRLGQPTFNALFPAIAAPNDLQRATIQIADAFSGPTLVIIEAPMGEGKTEAAMYMAEAAAARFGQTGNYFALPTQATSNQMFSRVREFLSRAVGGEVHLQLLHGYADLSAEFQTLRKSAARGFTPIYDETDQALETTVVAAEWFTYRKRGLLAPFGVGTVDQALMAVLKARHFFVRMFGLGGKAVVIDEVHAYDAYMITLMERLLEWLAASGSSVFLLSATLPSSRREALARAYIRGLGAAPGSAKAARYPRITYASALGIEAVEVAPSERTRRELKLEWLESEASLGEQLLSMLRDGGCAAIICNTVTRAQQIYAVLKASFSGVAFDGEPELMLFHARFPFAARDRREKLALVRFGKPDGKVDLGERSERLITRPERAVIVATQVIEQSLDLDFDAMISEFAPADLLLQRAGRLHRHDRPSRPAPLTEPKLQVLTPKLKQAGVPDFGGGTEAVYSPHLLLRSWVALRGRDAIRIPEDIESIIESVYGSVTEFPDDMNEALRVYWRETANALELDLSKRELLAMQNRIPDPNDEQLLEGGSGLEEDNPEIHASLQAFTRISEGPSVEVVVLTALDAATFDPSASLDRAAAHALLKRSVRLAHAGVTHALLRDESRKPPGWRRSALLRHHRVLVLNESNAVTIGAYEIALDSELGIVIHSAAGGL